jgi:hypothetical protein
MTLLTRWEPFREFSTMQDRMNRMNRERGPRLTCKPGVLNSVRSCSIVQNNIQQ